MSKEAEKTKEVNNKQNNRIGLEREKREPLKTNERKRRSKPVIIRAEAYKTIVLYASRYANKAIAPKNWKEIYGILVGFSDNDFVYVERAEALTFGHSTDVQLNEKHYVFIDEIQQKLDQEKKKYYIVGWFHSHPGLNLFFSYIDLLNQLGFQQNNEDFIGLVFDHTLLGKKTEETIKGENGKEHKITKYETGFEIYRLKDLNMNTNDPNYDTNYYKVEYIIEGLNKFFFASLLTELSALAAEGKPLQSAYGEDDKLEISRMGHGNIDSKRKKINKVDDKSSSEAIKKNSLVEIPVNGDIHFNFDTLFFGDDYKIKTAQKNKLKEEADQAIYEGNHAFRNKNAFMGIEKYRQGIEIYKKINDNDRTLHLLRDLSEQCIQSGHYIFAKEFIDELSNLSKKSNQLFYSAEANYLNGHTLLKEGGYESLELALKSIQQASIDYEKVEDYAGAGEAYYKIGSTYHSRLNKPYNACLFYIEAMISYNEAIIKGYFLRNSTWAKPESLAKKILELKDIVEELIKRIDITDERQKIINDLNSLKFNF